MYFLTSLAARFYTYNNHRTNENVRTLYNEKILQEVAPKHLTGAC